MTDQPLEHDEGGRRDEDDEHPLESPESLREPRDESGEEQNGASQRRSVPDLEEESG